VVVLLYGDGGVNEGLGNFYISVSLLLMLGLILGILFKKVGLTEILAYIFAGIIVGPLLGLKVPAGFYSGVTALALSLVGYTVGLTFSRSFLRRSGREVMIILVVEVLVTSFFVWLFTYVYTWNAPLSVVLASLAPATAPAGTIAVFRDLRSRGRLTEVATAVVGLDDAAGIIMYTVGIVVTKSLLGSHVTISASLISATWEILGAFALGLGLGFIAAAISRKKHLTQDHIFVIGLALAILGWGIADYIHVSDILTCMMVGTAIINFNKRLGYISYETIDKIMTPIFIAFFGAVGMEISPALFIATLGLASVYVAGRTVGKVVGCWSGAVIAKSEAKLKKYLGVALLNQAGVAVGLAGLAARDLAKYNLGPIIITIIATTTTIFQIVSPLGTQYAVKAAKEAHAQFA